MIFCKLRAKPLISIFNQHCQQSLLHINKFSFSKQNEQKLKESKPIQAINSEVKDPLSQSNQTQIPKQEQIKFNQKQQSLISNHQADETFNEILGYDKNHNFQKQLIVAQKQYKKSTKQLRANILFEDILKSQIDIVLYDTKGKPYAHRMMKVLLHIAYLLLTIWVIDQTKKSDPKTKVIFEKTTTGFLIQFGCYSFVTWMMLASFWKYRKFQKRYVEKIIFNTETEKFKLVKRGIFGPKFNYQISRYKMLYTQNEQLNKMGTNYFDLDTKQQFSIVFKQSWIKEDLFSHLIAQRIKK